MKKLLSVLLAAFVLSFLFASSFAQTSIVESVAIITDYEGDGSVKLADSDRFDSVSMNMPVYEGMQFKTGSGSFIEITFDDATIVRLAENTNLKLSELKRNGETKKTLFDLAVGKIMAIVDSLKTDDSSFEVHTKMAVAAVKGTELIVGSDGEEMSELGVYEGAVQYFSNLDKEKLKKALIKAGKQAKVLKGKDGVEGEEELKEELLRYKKEMGKLKEEITLVRKLKAEGKEKVIEYREKRKLEKEGKAAGESETTLTLGGKNEENTKKAEDRVKTHLKNKVRKELAGLRKHAMEDLKYVNKGMKADLNLGKSMVDVHGNRVRLEEYVFRPAKNQLDLLSLTFRENRIDYLRAQNIFNTDLPKRLTKDIWQSQWLLQPKVFKVKEIVSLSNTIDRVDVETTYVLDPKYNNAQSVVGNGIEEVYADNALWKLVIKENTLSINENLKTRKSLEFNAGAGIKELTDDANYKVVSSSGGAIYPGTDKLAWKNTQTFSDASTLTVELYLIDDYGTIQLDPKNELSSWVSLIRDTNVEMRLTSSDFVSEYGDIDIVSKMLWWIAINPKK